MIRRRSSARSLIQRSIATAGKKNHSTKTSKEEPGVATTEGSPRADRQKAQDAKKKDSKEAPIGKGS